MLMYPVTSLDIPACPEQLPPALDMPSDRFAFDYNPVTVRIVCRTLLWVFSFNSNYRQFQGCDWSSCVKNFWAIDNAAAGHLLILMYWRRIMVYSKCLQSILPVEESTSACCCLC
jgi:hypothetical protein